SDCPRLPWVELDRCGHARDVLVECWFDDPSSMMIQLGETSDGGRVIETGTGVTEAADGVLMRTHMRDVVGTNRTVFDRPVPIPASDKPVHEEFVLHCSESRKLRAEAIVCAEAKHNEVVFQRCVADYCLTGSESLARADIAAMHLQEMQS